MGTETGAWCRDFNNAVALSKEAQEIKEHIWEREMAWERDAENERMKAEIQRKREAQSHKQVIVKFEALGLATETPINQAHFFDNFALALLEESNNNQENFKAKIKALFIHCNGHGQRFLKTLKEIGEIK